MLAFTTQQHSIAVLWLVLILQSHTEGRRLSRLVLRYGDFQFFKMAAAIIFDF